MARKRSSTRRKPRALLRGVLDCRDGKNSFVTTAEGDFFIPDSARGGASDGDLVEVAPASGGRKSSGRGRGAERPQGRVVRVIERASEVVCGRVELADPFAVVVPDNPGIPFDIFTLRADAPDVPEGAFVQVRITQFPTRRSACTGVIEAVLSEEGGGSGGIDMIVARHKLETAFSEAALAEAAQVAVAEAEALAEGYTDLQERTVFTIDPADAKDFDDALSLERVRDAAGRLLWRLGVHIADVSAYVPWNSALDIEARRRATSVYLADRVIPMLPPQLSEEVCSLKPGQVRRAFTCDMLVTDQGQVLQAQFYPSLIRSKMRFTYSQVQQLLEREGDGPVSLDGLEVPEAMVRKLKAASALAQAMGQRRTAAGGIDFSTVEAKVRLDAEGAPVGVDLRQKTDATMLVEEAMIAANEAVARHLFAKDFPCLYRVHDAPAGEALAVLVPVFREFSWFARSGAALLGHGSPFVIQSVLEESHGRAEEELVSNLLLRAMKRAVYRPVNDGHYGLASKAYCHFTSPIRRYPDLVVHRMLKAALFKRPQLFDQEVAALAWIGEHSSYMERVAETAARESQTLKLAEFLEPRTGETFAGVVSGVSSQGLFVRLERGVTTDLQLGGAIEGFLPLRYLGPEYFMFDPDRYTLTGADTDQVFRLGQPLNVVLSRVDLATSRLDLHL